jgi:hypothetical protein
MEKPKIDKDKLQKEIEKKSKLLDKGKTVYKDEATKFRQ